jgi:hypothetical protein
MKEKQKHERKQQQLANPPSPSSSSSNNSTCKLSQCNSLVSIVLHNTKVIIITFALCRMHAWIVHACILLCPIGSLVWASDQAGPTGSIPARTDGLDRAQEKSGSGLGLKPSRPKLCLLKVCLANNVWAFGLKNVKATYQRAMTTLFCYMMH